MKAAGEVGAGRIVRFVWTSLLLTVFRRLWLPPLRVVFLRACGAEVGAGVVVHRLSFINVDRGGFRALRVGQRCFIGDEVLIDLAAPVVLEDDTTLAVRAMILTHLNVGFRDHPLQARRPSGAAGVTIRRGSFVGAGATILAGVSIGPEAFIGAAALVNRDVPAGATVVGVPARPIGDQYSVPPQQPDGRH
jgi:acetyltransferase-like isoleucine patch superfamily enzyme